MHLSEITCALIEELTNGHQQVQNSQINAWWWKIDMAFLVTQIHFLEKVELAQLFPLLS